MIKILVTDDEPAMRQGLADNLEFEGYQVQTAANGTEALTKLTAEHFDLLILDVMMPEISGFDVCRKLRQQKNDIPVILLTAKGEEIDRVLGLELGADDYISKPFSLRELMARVKAILRRTNSLQTLDSPMESIGLLDIDFVNYLAISDGKEVKLSHREFDVLHYLWKNKHQIVRREDLLKNIWQYDEFPTTRTIDNFILRLRQKIETTPNDPKIILTVHGLGYKMV
ncbi:MAG: response regulator transcription factor [Saprospiraceae bacterium]|nr:response regulator transcription factor [Saprospiraceae bacterium]